MTAADPAKMQAAHDLLAREGGWTQQAFARDVCGNMVWPTRSAASCFCLAGAVEAAGGGAVERELLIQVVGGSDIHDVTAWNDAPQRTQAEVVAVAARAVELARAA